MSATIQWTPVAKRQYTDGIWNVVNAARKSGNVSKSEVGEVVGRLVQTMPPWSRNQFIAKLSVDERMSATAWLEVFEHERIEAGLNAFFNIFESIAESNLGYHSSGRRTRINGESTLKNHLSSYAFEACPTPILGLQADHLSFLLNYADPDWGAGRGCDIAKNLLEKINDGKKFTRKLVNATIKEVLDRYNESRLYEQGDKKEDVIDGFTKLFMMVRG